jgi:DNA-binding transcriptional ArsR family regulator
MRGKDYSTGLRGPLFEAKHYERMGAAVWLYGWLVLRQTRQEGMTGWVLGGKPITYREIESETEFPPRTLERWMRILRRAGYVETDTVPGGVVVRITKAKKFSRAPGAPGFAGGVRTNAEQDPQNCVGDRADRQDLTGVAGRIGSGYLVREEKDNGFGLGKEKRLEWRGSTRSPIDPNLQAKIRYAAMNLRIAKEDELRKELRVGAGPVATRRVKSTT